MEEFENIQDLKPAQMGALWQFILAYKKHTGERLSFVKLIEEPEKIAGLALSYQNSDNSELAKLANSVLRELDNLADDLAMENESDPGKVVPLTKNGSKVDNSGQANQGTGLISSVQQELTNYRRLLERFLRKGELSYHDRLILDHLLGQLKLSDFEAIAEENEIRQKLGIAPLNWKQEFIDAFTKMRDMSKQRRDGVVEQSELNQLYSIYARPSRLSLDQIENIVRTHRSSIRSPGVFNNFSVKIAAIVGIIGIAFLINILFFDHNGILSSINPLLKQVQLTGQMPMTEGSTSPSSPIINDSLSAEAMMERRPLLRIHGSNTIGAELVPALAKHYLNNNYNGRVEQVDSNNNESVVVVNTPDELLSIDIEAHGSSTGFKSLFSGNADIAAASRPIKEKELELLRDKGVTQTFGTEHVIALDGVAIIVHSNNRLSEIGKQQLNAIFTGRIDNWRQLGGADAPINIYARDEGSGTFDTFKSMILGKEDSLASGSPRFESNEELANTVSQDINAIGFVSLNTIGQAKALAISDGSEAIFPTPFTIATEDYPLTRRLYLYTPNVTTQSVREFINFSLSDFGQQLVSLVGFVNLIPILQSPMLSNQLPEQYLLATDGKERLSISFRFLPGTNQLDTRAYRDLDRVVQFLHRPENRSKRLTLLGFSDSIGSALNNLELSKKRAVSVSKALQSRGLVIEDVKGLGSQVPIADNRTAAGRSKNRRVEVWLSN